MTGPGCTALSASGACRHASGAVPQLVRSVALLPANARLCALAHVKVCRHSLHTSVEVPGNMSWQVATDIYQLHLHQKGDS